MEKIDKKTIYYIAFSVVVIVALLVFRAINLRLESRCAAVSSYRGCLVEKNTPEDKFCHTRTKPCKDGKDCTNVTKSSCVPLYQF